MSNILADLWRDLTNLFLVLIPLLVLIWGFFGGQ